MTSPSGADAIAEVLAANGTRYLFGVPGGGNNLDVIGACERAGVEFVLAHTETGAAIMASAYSELTDTVGACVVTRGPGAASTVNGAAQAQQDRQPLVILCDTVDRRSGTRISHQQIDQRAMFAPVTKWSTTLGADDPHRTMTDVVTTARTAPAGAVHVDVDATWTGRDTPPAPPLPRGSVAAAAPLLAAAIRPVVIVGVGARHHVAAVRELVAGTHIPVLMTYKAKGVVPDSGPNSAGTFTGAATDSRVLDAADLILTIGLDAIELIPNPWDHAAPVVSLAEYPETHRYLEPTVEVIGPLDTLLRELPALHDGWSPDFATDFRAALTASLCNGPAATTGMTPWDVVTTVRAAARSTAIATVDAGAHMLAVMPLWTTEEPGQVLISSGLATMGYAVPAAIGAALARPDMRVFCFVGDGGLAMTLGELETMARVDLSVTVVVFDDATLSLIAVKQRAEGHGGARAVTYGRTDFAAVARGQGLDAVSVDGVEGLVAALSPVTTGPVLLDVRVDPGAYRHVLDVVRFGAVPR